MKRKKLIEQLKKLRTLAERGETLIFDNAAAAQAWIDEQESGRYYLDHNEAGRPTYYIIAA